MPSLYRPFYRWSNKTLLFDTRIGFNVVQRVLPLESPISCLVLKLENSNGISTEIKQRSGMWAARGGDV